jgi:hypothetical protein
MSRIVGKNEHRNIDTTRQLSRSKRSTRTDQATPTAGFAGWRQVRRWGNQ